MEMHSARPRGSECQTQPVGPHAKLAATMPHARRRRPPGAVLPLGGAVAPVAPTYANSGRFWQANGRQHGFVVVQPSPLAGSISDAISAFIRSRSDRTAMRMYL